jgi:hypothetical protein
MITTANDMMTISMPMPGEAALRGAPQRHQDPSHIQDKYRDVEKSTFSQRILLHLCPGTQQRSVTDFVQGAFEPPAGRTKQWAQRYWKVRPRTQQIHQRAGFGTSFGGAQQVLPRHRTGTKPKQEQLIHVPS